EGEVGLALASALDADLDQRACGKNGGKRSNPGLIVVLRAKVGENRIGKMAFQQFGGPEFPILEEIVEGFLSTFVTVTAEELAGGWRRSRAGVEQGDIDFAFREGIVDN